MSDSSKTSQARGPESVPVLDVCRLPLEGVHLIEASAGTGKTFNIAALFLRLIIEARLPIQQILAVTFTKAATSELRTRVEKRLREARDTFSERQELVDPILQQLDARLDRQESLLLLERALSDIDRAAIFTIHGFAARAIAESAFEAHAHFASEVLPDVDRLAYDAVVDFWSMRVSHLEGNRFARFGGLALFRELERVARAALTNVDTPTVPLQTEEAADARYREAESQFRDAVAILRERWGTSASDVRALIVSGRVKRNSFRDSFLDRIFREWDVYLTQDPLAAALPEGWERFRQSFITGQTAKGKQSAEHPVFAAVEALGPFHAVLAQQDGLALARLYEECILFVRARVQGEHERRGTRSFDDLLLVLRDALSGPGGEELKSSLEKRYRAALIDEFQDTDPLQYRVFREIFAERRKPALFLIGDPKQSIYAFRGADVLAYLSASADARANRYSLTTSYRSRPLAVSAQNALFESAKAPFLLNGIQYQSITPAKSNDGEFVDSCGQAFPGIDFVVLPERGTSLIEQAALEVHALLRSNARLEGRVISPKNIAILCRKNRDAQEAQAYLRALGVPAVMHGDRSVFESKEALEVRRLLRALLDPGHRVLLRAALATRLLGLGVVGIAELDEKPELLELWDARFRRWSDTWRERGFFRMMDAVFREISVIPSILGVAEGERIVTNLRHIVELLHQAEAEEQLGALGLFRYLESCIADPFGHAMADLAMQIRLESDEDAVTLTTIHKSKGLEYDIVVLPSLGNRDEPFEEPVFRTRNSEGQPELELRNRELAAHSHEIQLHEHRAEALRVGYVGLTRARHHTIVLLGKFHGKFSALSHWLRDDGPLGAPASNWEEPLRRLTLASRGSVRAREPAGMPAPEAVEPSATVSPLTLPILSSDLPARLADGLRTASFSSLTRSLARTPREALLGRDRDDAGAAALASDPSKAGALARLHDFPKGAVAGEALHEVFEKLVWGESGKNLNEAKVGEVLEKYGIAPGFSGAVLELVEAALGVSLPPLGIRLGELKESERAAETEFHISIASGESRVTASSLAQAVRDLECLPSSYRTGPWSLDFQDVRGFLRGFIDLVFESDERVYVVDYKSNFMGVGSSDYGVESMERSMNEHHYHIQGLIYAVAVARHARLLRPDYSHERHFGGIYYLFLRGLSGANASTGVYYFRPSEADLVRFEEAMAGP